MTVMVKAEAEELVNRLSSRASWGGGADPRESRSSEDLRTAGSQHLEAGRLVIAGSLYRSAIQTEPRLAEAHKNLSAVLLQLGKPQSAFAALQTALVLDPLSGSTYANLANMHECYGNIAQAEIFYIRALRLNPSMTDSFIGLARIDVVRKKWDNALSALNRAATIAPQATAILHQIGVVYLHKGDIRAAVESLRNAEARDQENPDIKASLAEALHLQGQTQEAKRVMEKSLALNPENVLGLAVKEKILGLDTMLEESSKSS